MTDEIRHLGASRIQLGPDNDRIYLMHLHPNDHEDIVSRLDTLAARGGYSKIFCKIPSGAEALFTSRGYRVEARIPPGPAGTTGLVFLSRFRTAARAHPSDAAETAAVLARVRRDPSPDLPPLPAGMRLGAVAAPEAAAVAALYASVFASYPFPIDQPAFIRRSMQEGVAWFAVRDGDRGLLAVASIEPSGIPGAVEMTDFATVPAVRGMGLGRHLLRHLGDAARSRGEALGYTIARAGSAGMNLVFAREGYAFAGTLVNNTQIGGRLESMNVWYRWLAPATAGASAASAPKDRPDPHRPRSTSRSQER